MLYSIVLGESNVVLSCVNENIFVAPLSKAPVAIEKRKPCYLIYVLVQNTVLETFLTELLL